MALVFNEEERLLRDTAREFLAGNAPVSALRTLRDEGDALGWSPELWRQMAELGWAGILLPEQYGGMDFGFDGMGAVLEETGRTLCASPLLATAVAGASALMLGGSDEQKESLLPALAAGEITFALALEEGPHHDPAGAGMRAQLQGDHYVLDGHKLFVADGHGAHKLIVVARTGGSPGETGGISLFLLDGNLDGDGGGSAPRCERTVMMDGRNAANLYFDSVKVGRDRLLGEAGEGWAVLEPVLDRARVALSAEMLGGALECFDRTLDYLKQREQFGALIGSFQALQHRAALMFIQLEMARSAVMQGLAAADGEPEQLPLLASLAKATVNEAARLVTNEAVQMHGGIGVTDDLDIGLFLKRARVAMQLFGDTGFHRDRYATLSGY